MPRMCLLLVFFMQNRQATPNIAFVAIDIIRDGGPEFKAYSALTSAEKTNKIEAAIIKICEQLKEDERQGKLQPNSMWIIAWREYGITKGRGDRFIDPKTKKNINQILEKLTVDYPQLTIIAGTLQTRKFVDPKKRAPLIEENYKALLDKFSNIESKNAQSEFNTAKTNVGNNQPLDMIRNSCFVFQNGKNVWTRSKTTPFNESHGSPNVAFHPGRTDNIVKDFKHPDPKVTKPVTIGVEICMEHALKVLKTIHPKTPPQIHLIISDTTNLVSDHKHGNTVIQIDSVKKASFEQAQFEPILFKSYDMLRNPNDLKEINAKNLVQKLKNYILQKSWVISWASFFGGKTISVGNINKKVPDQVFYQMKEIIKAEKGSISYVAALNKIIKIANDAQVQYKENDRRSHDTQNYYIECSNRTHLRALVK